MLSFYLAFENKVFKANRADEISYRDNLRIIAAKEMLESGIFSATEIAAELGYCDIYHFSKVFKKYVGVSPTEYNK